ncbi:hypothetical protein C0214_17515 [Methylobacterium sp. DM1]|nr:hypothetical protein C0214_17515 [Methylobacterium sp. DM1]
MSINPYGDRLFAEFYTCNDPDVATRLAQERLADDFVDHSPVFGATPDKAGFTRSVSFINSAFRQDYHVERTIEQGDTVVAIWSANGEHVGQFMHVAPTGARFRLKGITAYALRDGRITAHWEQFDVLAILMALGIVPPLGG